MFKRFLESPALLGLSLMVLSWYLFLLIWPKWVRVLPWPHMVIRALISFPLDSAFRSDFAATIWRASVGFILGNLSAIPFGFLMNRFRPVRICLVFLFDFFRSLPAVVFLFLVTMLFDPATIEMYITLITIPVFLVMTLHFLYGLDRCSVLRKGVARKLGLKDKEIFLKVEMREALPEIITGMRTSISISLIVTVVVEMYFPTKGGLGAFIYSASQNVGKTADLWAAIVVLGLLGFSLNQIFVYIDRKYCFWRGK